MWLLIVLACNLSAEKCAPPQTAVLASQAECSLVAHEIRRQTRDTPEITYLYVDCAKKP
jgi:hypothetical protein